jgi:hypothetical protein
MQDGESKAPHVSVNMPWFDVSGRSWDTEREPLLKRRRRLCNGSVDKAGKEDFPKLT